MTSPGPIAFGRAVVVAPGAPAPDAWADTPRTRVDQRLLDDGDALAEAVDRLHHAWAAREPQVVELVVEDRALAEPESSDAPPWQLGAEFTFLRERLHSLVWANSYDARRDPPMWWWAVKAEAAGAEASGPADIRLPDGRAAWVDGGPRAPLTGVAEPVVHAETVLAGSLDQVPAGSNGAAGGLAADQRAAVHHHSGPARIIAPAGSGKTRTLVARLRHLVETRRLEPGSIGVLAYNARAAQEMRERLPAGLGVRPRTVHSLGWEILQEARGGLHLLDEPSVRSRLDSLVEAPRRPNVDVLGPYLEALGEVRVGLRSPHQVATARDDVPDLVPVHDRYRETLARRREADFDEQVFGAIEALLADPALRRRWQGRCRHLLVDEFQDITPAYLLLIRLLASPSLDVFAVGDDDQTIYGYAGADPQFLLGYDRLFPGAGSHALETNYRSPAPVVVAATRLLGYNRRRIPKTITAADGAAVGPEAFQVLKPEGSALAIEAADRISAWLDDGDPAEIVVLCRVNSALLPVHAALADRGIPFRSPLGPGLLQRTVLAATLAWVRLAENPDRMRRADLLAAVRRPSRGLNRLARELLGAKATWTLEAVDAISDGLAGRQLGNWQQFSADLRLVTAEAERGLATSLIDTIVSKVGLDSAAQALDGRRSRADRAAQSDDLVALRRAAAVHPDLGGFRTWLREVLDHPADADGVLLTTVHRVKGMEWDRVVVYGADRGLLPHDLSTDWEEERRVLHVAVTRGRREVVVLADRERPSPFLAELAGEAPEPAAPQAPAGRTTAVAPLAALGPADPDLVDALKAWRLEAARARGVPAYVVLHDRTIEEIAVTRPVTEVALAAVSGIGPAKLEAYGDDIIELCRS